MSPLKLSLLVVWVACLAGFAGGDAGWAVAGRSIFWLMLVVHAVECLVFLPRLRQAPGPLAGHLVQVLLFGVAHLRELPARS